MYVYIYIYKYKIIRKTSLTIKKASDPSDKLFYREILLLLRNDAIFILFYRRIIIYIYIYTHIFFPSYSKNRIDSVSFFSFFFSFSSNKLCIPLYLYRLFTFTALDETLVFIDAWNFSPSRFTETDRFNVNEGSANVSIFDGYADEFSEFRVPDRVVSTTFTFLCNEKTSGLFSGRIIAPIEAFSILRINFSFRYFHTFLLRNFIRYVYIYIFWT